MLAMPLKDALAAALQLTVAHRKRLPVEVDRGTPRRRVHN